VASPCTGRPTTLKLIFHGFVVLVGVLILAGAQNTSIVGAKRRSDRVAEDGVLTEWFQKPQKRFAPAIALLTWWWDAVAYHHLSRETFMCWRVSTHLA